jgi:hypothetical protein
MSIKFTIHDYGDNSLLFYSYWAMKIRCPLLMTDLRLIMFSGNLMVSLLHCTDPIATWCICYEAFSSSMTLHQNKLWPLL